MSQSVLFYTKMNNYLAVAWREQATYQWNDDDVCFVLVLETTVRVFSYVFILFAY
jgi:hypothetical protein